MPRDPRRWLVATLAVGLGLIFLLGWTMREVDGLRLRLGDVQARSLALSSRLGERGAAGQRQAFEASHVWRPRGDATTEQGLQDFALGALQSSNLTLVRYEQASLAFETTAPTITLRLEFQGLLRGLVRLLELVEASEPKLAVDRLDVRMAPDYEQRPGETQVSGQLVLWGFAGDAPA